MTNVVKQFIEENINIIEHESWQDLFDLAYEWLDDIHTDELIIVLTQALNQDVQQHAKDALIKHIDYSLKDFAARKFNYLHVVSFINRFMTQIFGLSVPEFSELLYAYLKGHPYGIKPETDGNGELYLRRD